MATIYGIDTGSWRVRIAAVEGSFRRWEVRDAAQVPVATAPDGTALVADALQSLRAEEPGWEAADKVAAFPLDHGVVRLVRLPFSDRNAIARALPAEVESQVPYDLEDMTLGIRVIDTREGQSRTAVFIAPKDGLRGRIDGLGAAGAEPRLLCFDADALSAYADQGVQVVVDIGHRRTVMALCQGGQLLAARLVPSGGLALTEAIRAQGAQTMEDAENAKHAMVLPSRSGEVRAGWDEPDRTDTGAWIPPAAWLDALDTAVDAWCAEVRAELIALEDELNVGIDELLLCGGGSHLAGLGERLAARVGVPARPVLVPGGHPVDYALVVALARAGAGEVLTTDLRAGEFAYHGTAETMWRVVLGSAAVASLGFVGLLAMFGVQLYDANARLAELDEKIIAAVTGTFPDVDASRLGEPSMALAIMQEKTAETTARVDALGATVSGTPPTLEMLRTLSERVPPHKEARIDVRELTITEDSVSFKAETDSYESAAKIEESLKEEERFKDARKSDEKKVGEALTFTMNIPLGGAEGAAAGEEG